MIKFTGGDGRAVYVNPNLVRYFGTTDDNIVVLFFTPDDILQVKETEEEVLQKLYGQQLNPFTRTGNYDKL